MSHCNIFSIRLIFLRIHRLNDHMTPLGNHLRILLLSIIFTLITVGNQSLAQEPSTAGVKSTNPHTLIIQQSIALMEQSQWQQTLDLLNPLIEQNQNTGLKEHGAKFATTYYYQGLCLLKLAQAQNKIKNKTTENNQQAAKQLFRAAIQSLNQCYAINPPNDPSNTYRVKSLLLRGNAQQALGKYQLAIDSYQLFLLERNNALDPYNLSDFNINLAICLWKKTTPQRATPAETKQAISLLQESLLYTGRNQPSPRAVLTALATLTDIATQKPTEYAGLISSTLQRSRTISPGNLILARDPSSSESSSSQLLPLLSKLILHSAQKNLPLASLHLSTLIPGISQHSVELEIPVELEFPTLEQNQANQDNQATKNATAETMAIALQARALTFQNSNRNSSAIRLYKLLVNRYPGSTHQPVNLYNLARLAAQTGDTTTAIARARQFLKYHPQHSLKTPTLTILLNTLYHTKQYQPSLTLAEEILSNKALSLIKPSDPNTISLQDSASFIRAASHYYLGNFAKAASLLTSHQTAYPDSPYQTDSAYLTAAVQNQLLHWDTSIPLLRKFIAEHSQDHSDHKHTEPTSIYLPFASYDIAFAQYSQRHLHSAILTLLPFTLDIPFVNKPYNNSQISPSAAILLGNTHLLLRQRDSAVAYYQTAIQLAKDTGNTDALEEAYYLLIDLLGKPLWEGLTNHRLKETIPHYLRFLTLENAQKSPYHTQILTSAITALEKANLTEPVHLLLQENLFLHNNSPNTPGTETALKTYLYYLRKDHRKEDHRSEKILRILTEDVKTSLSAYHQALLIAAKIETLEHAQARNPDSTFKAQINQLYQELVSQYRTADLNNFTLLKTAEHLAKSNKLTEAASYFQAIIESSSNINKTEARLGLAIQLANSNTLTQQEKQSARTQLTDILENPFTPPATRATAHYHIIKLLRRDENWQQIESNALAYLNYPLDVKTHNQEILQMLARSYDNQGPEKIDLAISTYTHIWVKTLFSIQNSAPAIDRVCQLLWDRNNPADSTTNGGKSDRQLAYETAYKYIRKTKDHLAQRKANLPASAIQTWQAIKTKATKTYPKDPDVKPFSGQP